VDFKFGSSCGMWCSNEPRGSLGLGLWKNIRRGWGKFSSHTKFEVRDCSNVDFWHNLWCGDKALKEGLPVCYMVLLARRMLLQRLTLKFLVAPISGT
jgi:hypothetical protein